jgi:hypothetical protein
MFRPAPEAHASLYVAVEQYNGDVVWQMHDGCIGAWPARLTFYSPYISREQTGAKLEEPPHADPEFVRRALADVPNLCLYLEARLALRDKSPEDFDPQWLTREGLATSRGELGDFFEPGSWTVMLARNPEKSAETGQPTSPEDRPLSFGIGLFERDALFSELGADWKKYSEGQGSAILPEYPLLSRLDEITADAIYHSNEVDRLLAECQHAQTSVKDPRAIRGLDKLIRIAHWAQELKLGICFGGE